eukprot:gene5358-3854_t
MYWLQGNTTQGGCNSLWLFFCLFDYTTIIAIPIIISFIFSCRRTLGQRLAYPWRLYTEPITAVEHSLRRFTPLSLYTMASQQPHALQYFCRPEGVSPLLTFTRAAVEPFITPLRTPCMFILYTSINIYACMCKREMCIDMPLPLPYIQFARCSLVMKPLLFYLRFFFLLFVIVVRFFLFFSFEELCCSPFPIQLIYFSYRSTASGAGLLQRGILRTFPLFFNKKKNPNFECVSQCQSKWGGKWCSAQQESPDRVRLKCGRLTADRFGLPPFYFQKSLFSLCSASAFFLHIYFSSHHFEDFFFPLSELYFYFCGLLVLFPRIPVYRVFLLSIIYNMLRTCEVKNNENDKEGRRSAFTVSYFENPMEELDPFLSCSLPRRLSLPKNEDAESGQTDHLDQDFIRTRTSPELVSCLQYNFILHIYLYDCFYYCSSDISMILAPVGTFFAAWALEANPKNAYKPTNQQQQQSPMLAYHCNTITDSND